MGNRKQIIKIKYSKHTLHRSEEMNGNFIVGATYVNIAKTLK